MARKWKDWNALVNEFPNNALKAVTVKPIPLNQWHHLTLPTTGKVKEVVSRFTLMENQPMQVTHDLSKTISTNKHFALAAVLKDCYQRFRIG